MFKRFLHGDFLPVFSCASSALPRFSAESLGGKQFLLAFVGSGQSEKGQAMVKDLMAAEPLLKSLGVLCYVVTGDPRDRDSGDFEHAKISYTAFWDTDLAVHQAYGMASAAQDGERPMLRIGVFVIKENMRLHSFVPLSPAETFRARLEDACRELPRPLDFIRIERQAPVLLIPDVFDRDFCRRLIDVYETKGGWESGFMRETDGITHGVMDNKYKRRKDVIIDDPQIRQFILRQVGRRLAPEIKKAFDFSASCIERYIVACYDSNDRGFFRAHRDNTSAATRHRRFAVSINLNSEEFEGGDLWFPEYGRQLYKPPTGGAVVFSCSLLHEARPVTAGRRFAFLPFLYDSASVAVRTEGAKFLSRGPVMNLNDPVPVMPEQQVNLAAAI